MMLKWHLWCYLHIARLRALELQRPVVRATNTGATAVIDHQGRVLAMLTPFTRGVLEASVQGRRGITPYAAWTSRHGLWPLVLAALAVLAPRALSKLRTWRRIAPSASDKPPPP